MLYVVLLRLFEDYKPWKTLKLKKVHLPFQKSVCESDQTKMVHKDCVV